MTDEAAEDDAPEPTASESVGAAIRLLEAAFSAHDLDALLACFDADYASEQPADPARSFRGVEQVRERWSANFRSMPDFRAELLDIALDGQRAWTEWHWHGTRPDGTRRDERGVIIYRVESGRITAGRLFMLPVVAEASDARR